jgi:hypothetical protein
MKFGKIYDSEDHESKKSESLFTHLFDFEGDKKADILNVLQYSLISLIPLILLNKAIKHFIPEATDEKGSVEIVAEVIAQIVLILLGLILIDRFCTYFKTYSGVDYPYHSVLFFCLGPLLVLLSIQSKLGEKVAILSDRFMDFFGKSDNGNKKKKTNGANNNGGNSYLVNPQSGTKYAPDVQMMSLPVQQPAQGTTRIDSIPNAISQSLENSFMQMPSHSDIGGGLGMGEPMAANSLLGGSFGSSW